MVELISNTADRLQKRMSHFFISPSWCVVCCSDAECPNLLLGHCSLHLNFVQLWWKLLVVLSGFNFYILAPVFVGHLSRVSRGFFG